jgi:hypothetical protein
VALQFNRPIPLSENHSPIARAVGLFHFQKRLHAAKRSLHVSGNPF